MSSYTVQTEVIDPVIYFRAPGPKKGVDMSMFQWMEIPDGYMMPGPHSCTAAGNQSGITTSSNYLLVSDGELGLVDTGMRGRGLDELTAKIDALGSRLQWIVLTHFHYDHIGNAEPLARRYDCPVLAHSLDVPAIENPLSVVDGSWVLPEAGVTLKEISIELGENLEGDSIKENYKKYFSFPVKVDEKLEEGDDLALGSLRLKVLNTPGHSPGSVSLFNPESWSLYIGDLDIGMNPSRPWPIGSAEGLMAAIRAVLNLNSGFLGPGHSLGVFGEEAVREYLEDMLDRTVIIQQRIEECLVRMGQATVGQLAGEVFPVIERYAYPPIHKHTVHCYLHKLVKEGKVRRLQEEGLILWEAIV